MQVRTNCSNRGLQTRECLNSERHRPKLCLVLQTGEPRVNSGITGFRLELGPGKL